MVDTNEDRCWQKSLNTHKTLGGGGREQRSPGRSLNPFIFYYWKLQWDLKKNLSFTIEQRSKFRYVACSSAREDNMPSEMKVCLYFHIFVLSWRSEGHMTRCQVSARRVFKCWEDTAKVCDVIKNCVTHLQRRLCLSGLLVRALRNKERSSTAILVKN
jgi:hypothetical protein